MDLLFNDLSIHGQFQDLSSFRESIDRVMRIRGVAKQFGREVHCHRNVAYAQVTPGLLMAQAVNTLPMDQRRALMGWLTRQGPFWEDARAHGPDDYLECNESIVTDNAVGEAAYCCLHGIERHLVSLIPSSWRFSPVPVDWVRDGDARTRVEVQNHWDLEEMEAVLCVAPTPLRSWKQLETAATARCPSLHFSRDAFESLLGVPFAGGAAQRLLVLLTALNRLRACIDERGQRTPEGHRIYQDHFTGDKAWFSDSSDSEKNEFKAELTFRHPKVEGQVLFCTWHGKVKTPQLRIHFTWPVDAEEPLYVVYVGPKITRR